jgi:hypothetical protein
MTVQEPDDRPCPRCAAKDQQIAELREQVAELEAEVAARLRFRRCGYPGTAMAEVTMSGMQARGWLCRPHQILLAPFVHLEAMSAGTVSCGWLVLAEEVPA